MVASPSEQNIPGEQNIDSNSSRPYPFNRSWRISDAIPLACILEASAPKAGNVHPAKGFADMHFAHFVGSAIASGSVFSEHLSHKVMSVGQLVLDAVEATQTSVGCNTNLGTLLLLAPLVSSLHASKLQEKSLDRVASLQAASWQHATQDVLNQLDDNDSQLVYEAIRRARPGGLGKQSSRDVQDTAPKSLVQAMQQVAEVDAVARQYCNGFSDIFNRLLPWFESELERSNTSDEAICRLQVRQLAHEPDGLIVRKVGLELAEEAQELARNTLQELEQPSNSPIFLRDSYGKLDRFLRADSNQRNPGTSADLIAATIFTRLLLQNGSLA